MTQRIRIVLADDHVMVRQGIPQFLEEAGDKVCPVYERILISV
jgi:DNA-binding NarL/FixJ family response regulator